MNHNMAVRDEQKEPEQAQAEIEVDVAKENAKAWDKMVSNKKQKIKTRVRTHTPWQRARHRCTGTYRSGADHDDAACLA